MNKMRAVPAEIQDFIHHSHRDMIATGIDEEATLHISVYGECGSCPYNCLSSEGELTSALLEAFPEIKRVSLTPAISEESLNLAKKILRGEGELQ